MILQQTDPNPSASRLLNVCPCLCTLANGTMTTTIQYNTATISLEAAIRSAAARSTGQPTDFSFSGGV
jgi:hypothetical protein